jgi:hypothetical protein
MKKILLISFISSILLVSFLIQKKTIYANHKLSCPDCNLVIISLSNLRKNNMSYYGYPVNTTPNVDEFFKKSFYFERAIAPASLTFSDAISFFYSLQTNKHKFYNRSDRDRVIAKLKNSDSLTKILEKNGYSTAAFVSDEDYVFENVNQALIDTLKKHKLYTTDVMKKILKYGSIAYISEIPVAIRNLFKTAQEIAPEWHLKHQLAFQKYTDNAVSKTINLPETATKEEVAAIFSTAYFWKAKGISIFRYNSKDKQVLNIGVETDASNCNICRPTTNRTQFW